MKSEYLRIGSPDAYFIMDFDILSIQSIKYLNNIAQSYEDVEKLRHRVSGIMTAVIAKIFKVIDHRLIII